MSCIAAECIDADFGGVLPGGGDLAKRLIDIYFSLFKMILEGHIGRAAAAVKEQEAKQPVKNKDRHRDRQAIRIVSIVVHCLLLQLPLHATQVVLVVLSPCLHVCKKEEERKDDALQSRCIEKPGDTPDCLLKHCIAFALLQADSHPAFHDSPSCSHIGPESWAQGVMGVKLCTMTDMHGLGTPTGLEAEVGAEAGVAAGAAGAGVGPRVGVRLPLLSPRSLWYVLSHAILCHAMPLQCKTVHKTAQQCTAQMQ